MTNYAQINGTSVSNIIAADDKSEAELVLSCTLIEITPENNAGIGYTYDSETGLFTNPYTVAEEAPIDATE